MSKIKLLVCYHKPDTLIKDEIITPIHVGRALAKKRMAEDDPKLKWLMENMIGDDTGDNISELNGCYNELTSLYWAWKNYKELGNPDYIGLMHYRRHFVFNEGEIKVYSIPDMNSPLYFDMLNYSPEKLDKIVSECDFVCHLGRVGGIYKHYLANHRIEDMELTLKILKETFPAYTEAANEYMMQNVGNFCNMFIFPREMFFEYCEFVFTILEKFRSIVDVSEKRFFVSERISGIFIYKKIMDGMKYKNFPINFVAENIDIPVAYNLTKEDAYNVCVSISSLLLKSDKKGTSYTFHIVYNPENISKDEAMKLSGFEKEYSNCRFNYIETDTDLQYTPLFLSEKLPNVRKCIIFGSNVVAMHDLAEFFRTCNLDDYYICALPENDAVNKSDERKLRGSIYVLNCERFRKHGLYEKSKELIGKSPCNEILNKICNNQIGYFAYWFVTDASLYNPGQAIPAKSKGRNQIQTEATWRPVLYFDDVKPYENVQSIFSRFWWEYAVQTPMIFTPSAVNSKQVAKQLCDQQITINHIGEINKRRTSDDMKNDLVISENQNEVAVQSDEINISIPASKSIFSDIEKAQIVKEQKQQSTNNFIKVRNYYKANGAKKTLKKIKEKLVKG